MTVVLVTGATGFVGPHVCSALRDRDWEVRAAVRTSGARFADGCVEVRVGDLTSPVDWHAALTGVDAVVHLAGRVHAPHRAAAGSSDIYRRINCDATLRLAGAAAEVGVSKFVFASSVKVHGEGTPAAPIDESSSLRPADAYAQSKVEAERGLADIAASGKLAVTVVRAPLVFGPGVGANFLRMIRWVASGVPLPLASIRNRRSFVYVGNLASAIAACVDRPAAGGRSYLVADDPPRSTPGLIRALADALTVPARLVPCPEWLLRSAAAALGRGHEAERLLGSLVVDGSAIRAQLDWDAPFSLEEGLLATAQWYRRTYS